MRVFKDCIVIAGEIAMETILVVERDDHNLIGVEQEIEAFDSVETPFHVALVLDTSGSTKFKLEDIQKAVFAFVKELKRDDISRPVMN